MLHYIIQTIAFQLFFLIIYDFFLKEETFFNWNRVYLLATSLVSVFIPFIKIESFKNVMSQNFIITLPEVVLGQSANSMNEPAELNVVIINNDISLWAMVFYIGAALALLVFLYKMTRILILIFKNPKTYSGKLTLINLLNSNSAFSFFRYVFLGDLLKNEEKETILKHEIIHVKQLHSIDLLYFEILRILFWFNPLVYMYQNRITTLHEFIADAEAVKHQNKSQYYQKLLSQVFDTQKISFINTFFNQSLIKKRIVMLQKSKSKQVKLLKYALLIPMVLGMLVYSSCEKESETDLHQFTYRVNVIDVNSNKSSLSQAKESESKLVDFLKSNEGYVVWVDYDMNTTEFIYSIHPDGEQIPEDYEFINASSPTGFNYKMYAYGTTIYRDPNKQSNSGDISSDIEVPFAVIEQVPIFPGCEGMTNTEQKECVSQKITEHVSKNFNTKIAEENELEGRQSINVIFIIDKEGNITSVKSRAPHPALEVEAKRVINLLPKMIPGKQKGHDVAVPYSLPIVFQVK